MTEPLSSFIHVIPLLRDLIISDADILLHAWYKQVYIWIIESEASIPSFRLFYIKMEIFGTFILELITKPDITYIGAPYRSIYLTISLFFN